VPAVITVTSTDDTIMLDGFISLREALTAANTNAVSGDAPAGDAGFDTIKFNIAGAPGTVHTIQPMSVLPPITEPVFINGYSQPGASANTLADGDNAFLAIELDGINAGLEPGLTLAAGNSTVQGLIINRFGTDGIDVIGGSGNVIRGNFIGTDQTGQIDRGNGVIGIGLFTSNNTVGGTARTARNLISGNKVEGIEILNPNATGNLIQGNLIGTDDTGTKALGNGGPGVRLFSGMYNTIGGTAPGAGNRIAFNTGAGVLIVSNEGSRNAVLGNAIFANGGLGIDLRNDGPTANDPLDADYGPNGLQNFPELTSAVTDAAGTTVQGTLQSTPNAAFRIELFASDAADPSGFGEAQTFLGFAAVATDAQGIASFTFHSASPTPVGKVVTATATEFLLNNTSELSPAIAFGTPEQKFVQALYLDELSRPGDVNNPADAGAWVNVLVNQTLTAAQVAVGIAHSPEARTRLVRGWYQTYLGRTAQGGEEQGWVSLLLQGATEEHVLSGILGSDELFDRAQTLGGPATPDERFVQALYQLALGRPGSAAEVAGWVNVLPQLGRPGVALGFLASAEYRAVLFTAYYQGLLHRPPDADGLSGWVDSALDASGVRVGFEASPEFFAVG
jgi:hypothetical protein